MAAITNELITAFKFNGSIAPLQNYNASFTSALSLMSKGIGIVTAINGAMMSFASSQLQSVDAMGQLSRETGVAVEYFQELGYVASVNGGSVDALQNSVRGLSERIGEYASQDSGEGKAIFEKLGIAVKNANGEVKNADEVMDELRHKFVGMSKAEQISIAQKLGIDKGMLQTLNLTNEQLEETRKRVKAIGVVSKDDAERVMAFNDAVTTSNMALSSIGRQIALGMLPSMMNLVEAFNNFIFTNGDLITNGLSKTVYWFQAVMSSVTNTGKAIYGAIDYFIGIENALMIAGAAALYFGRAMVLNPVGAAVAGITLLIAVVDDLYTMFQGGDSVIKDFFAGFNVDIINVLKTAFDGLKMTFNSLLILMLRLSEAFTSLVLVGAKAGNFLGMNIDTKGIEAFNQMQQQSRTQLQNQNMALGQGIADRSYTANQTITVNQTISGQDAGRIAQLSSEGVGNGVKAATAQIAKGGR